MDIKYSFNVVPEIEDSINGIEKGVETCGNSKDMVNETSKDTNISKDEGVQTMTSEKMAPVPFKNSMLSGQHQNGLVDYYCTGESQPTQNCRTKRCKN